MITEVARAKLNLALHIRARRPDGYHELETLFAFVADGDRLTLSAAEADSFEIVGPFAVALAGESDNLVLRALGAFRRRYGVDAPLAIRLDKRLPVASGIGGGSADAAAALRALARHFDRAFDTPDMLQCGLELGSDVPACLLSRTVRGSGRGETLVPLDGPAGMPVLLVHPGTALSTAAVFAGWRGIDHGPLPDGSVLEVAQRGRNDLQPPAQTLAPVIGECLDLMQRQDGAVLTRMSGSGATCFSLYETAAARNTAAAAIAAARPDWWLLETELV
ncbi:4-(cytidine 5'-diphospho)-2-C-methyl-D-erythritol kinase [Stakelama saccharophila]|uniref:4-diphosphocytidyl-2-C-methyl-D-erythritol kinase n=1 Tax=Stakelama saccharophila TaxID=3075605 RepID=A0ABZ0B5E4_9SPHN|nr:4-(cytidine 5'-diphospho)-2-C-methyl-D-erythritol kinase [Stakelama sp. W311]WNO52472.1 4-(cytidine 5'-diphospho)-2-C-methyl-D-erythritol kinase [Stakelama sp. W311]